MAVAPAFPETLTEVLARHAAQRPAAVAVDFEGSDLSYGALAHSSEAVAALVVALVLRPGAAAVDQELRAFPGQRLARYKLPRRWLRLETQPRTALGKVRRPALVALAKCHSL